MGASRREWLVLLKDQDGQERHVRRVFCKLPEELVIPTRDGSAALLYQRDRFAPAFPGYAEYREVERAKVFE